MSYKTQAAMSVDPQLLSRVTACAASLGVANPVMWVESYKWQLCATSGWDEAYAYAVNTEVPEPGNNESVITDALIHSTVEAMLNQSQSRGN